MSARPKSSENSQSPLLVIVYGASGSGKTSLLQDLVAKYSSVSIHCKGTDRPLKRYDTEEIKSLPEVSPADYDFIYHQYGHHYGLQRSQIDAALAKGKDHFVICNDIDTITALKDAYPGRTRAVYLLFDSPKAHVEALQRARGIQDDEIRLRLQKIAVLSDLYLQNRRLFDAVIVNRLGAPLGNLAVQLRQFIGVPRELPAQSLPTPAQNARFVGDIVEIIERQQHECKPAIGDAFEKNYLFILMPFKHDDSLLEDTHNAIKQAAKTCGYRAERADDITHTDRISDKILGSIRMAEIIVADITHSRPNVYYEIGYAHAYEKHVILIARAGTKPHFDINNYPIFTYKNASLLQKELEQRISALAE